MLYGNGVCHSKQIYYGAQVLESFVPNGLFRIGSDSTCAIRSCVTFEILAEETDLIVFPAQCSFPNRGLAAPW